MIMFCLTIMIPVVLSAGCDQNPCQNNKACYDIGENAYECICEEFAGKNCEIQPPSVSCEAIRIAVELDRDWLIEKVGSDNYRHIYMGSGQSQMDNCKAEISEIDNRKLTVKLEKNFRQCGTSVRRGDNGNFIYENKVYFNLQNAGIQTAISALVQWTCEYEDSYTVSYDAGLNPTRPKDDGAKVRSIVGDYNLNLRAYTKPIANAEDLLPSYVTVESKKIFHVIPNDMKWISFKAMLTGEAQKRGSKISMNRCVLSANVNPSDDDYSLIESGCPTEQGQTHIYTNGQSHAGKFTTNLAQIRRNNNWIKRSPFYFHCEIRVCPDGEFCPIGCASNKTETNGIKGEELKLFVSTGPYFIQGSKALQITRPNSATLEEEDAEHMKVPMLSAQPISGDIPIEFSPKNVEEMANDENNDFPITFGLAIISLLAICVISGFITIYNRSKVAAKAQKTRQGTHVDIKFSHEGSLQNVQNQIQEVQSVRRQIDLPGNRLNRHNYV